MKRWSSFFGKEVENPKIDAFIAEVIELCKKHGLSISHEDNHGAFIIEDFSEDRAQWLMYAEDGVRGKI